MDFNKLFALVKTRGLPKCSAVIVAAGSSTRMGQDKMLMNLGGKPVIVRTIQAFEKSEFVDEIILVTKTENIEQMAELVNSNGFLKVKKVIAGGATRAESSLAGVCAVKKNADLIAIHDGARPFVSEKLIRNCVYAALDYKSAVPGISVSDTLKMSSDGVISGDIDREGAVRIQTPQVFNADLIKGALTFVISKKIDVTDDSSAVEYLRVKTKVVEGDPDNIKLTSPADVDLAESILNRRSEL